ncbi:MAG: GDP-mannose 4,6-dehydratase [Acidobacteriia bacterium]|nr:GDP-mannose 4,6-dehydratase [Terriglobia bacterium]
MIHAAGRSIVTESIHDPLLYYRNNVLGTISLLEAMKKCNVKPLIFSSSASIYDSSQGKPLKEEDPKRPLHPYGKSKWMIEEMLADLMRRIRDIRADRIRVDNPPFDVSGEGTSLK